MDKAILDDLTRRYKADPESVYNTWFVNSEARLKAFRAIRRGVQQTVDGVAQGSFGNDFKGSPLEVVLAAISEQKQVFEGAAHPFYWKPKLRIPDIYENETNKRLFASFLDACLNATHEAQLLDLMSRLSAAKIKGLGPSVANIVYFLHPTLVPPFNTAMLNGYNLLFAEKKKLGSWESYLEMRQTIVAANATVRDILSNDLGAFAGLLYEIGSGRQAVTAETAAALNDGKQTAQGKARARHEEVLAEGVEETEHTRIQQLLIRIGRAMKYDVHVARNDRHRSCDGESFALSTLAELPEAGFSPEVADTVALIDVLWLRTGSAQIVCAFEIEKSTSIYSGMLRMQDLARSMPGCCCDLYLIAPDDREDEVMAQMARPSFRDSGQVYSFIPFGELRRHCESLCRFGEDHATLRKIVRTPPA